MPRRMNEGFAEVVSSPQVASQSFLFGGSSETISQPDLSQLASHGTSDL